MTDVEKLAEIHRLLVEAYDRYFAEGDGHCKSSEGVVSITWTYPTYWELKEGKRTPERSVEVYSYVLGPSRQHYFPTLDDALENVREWHEGMMSHDYEADRLAEDAYWAEVEAVGGWEAYRAQKDAA